MISGYEQQSKGRPIIYESHCKIVLAKEYLTGNLGYKALAKKYGIKEYHTVRHFVRWYKKYYPQEDASVLQREENHTTSSSAGQSDNDKQISKQLKEANLKIAGLEMLIENAQKELGVDIVKKSGTKQLCK